MNTVAMAASQAQLSQQLLLLTSQAQNLAATAGIPAGRLDIVMLKAEKIPQLQQRIDSAAKKLLEAHKAITYLRSELETIKK